MAQVVVEIEPVIAPVADHADAAIGRENVVATDIVALCAWIGALALTQIVENGSRKPVNVAIEDSHGRAPCAVGAFTANRLFSSIRGGGQHGQLRPEPSAPSLFLRLLEDFLGAVGDPFGRLKHAGQKPPRLRSGD